MRFKLINNFLFLETNRFDRDNYKSYLFTNPTKIISCYALGEVQDALLEIENFVSKGCYAAGFFSYELGFALEDTLRQYEKGDDIFPLLYFGIYKNPRIFTHREKKNFFAHKPASYEIKKLRPDISRKEYVNNIEKIKSYIRKGDTYQVNYTFKYLFDFRGCLYSLYDDLKSKQSVSYASFIRTMDFSILSLSPELFFRKNGQYIEVRPMKGTFNRGRDSFEDERNIEELQKSLKNRSENVMIVDLLRNDLGRISVSGSVKTRRLFEVEKYETLLQMISIVKSRLKKDIGIAELLRAIFPSGSVTGAPKISTMKIINSLEKGPRRIYTGSIGFFGPNMKEAVFNVAIRTVLVNNKANKGEMGTGSGIVYDSNPNKEYDECKLKADFITKEKRDFKLIETMLWRKNGGYFLLPQHLDRLSSSAEYFNFQYDRKYISGKLKILEKTFDKAALYRVRLLLDRNGEAEVSFTKIKKPPGAYRIGFSDKKVSSDDIFLYHKTTQRLLYDKEHKKWSKRGYFDIIFTNEKNEVTEGAISNIIIRKGRFYYTPPVTCGLLNGVFRQYLFDAKEIPIKEKVLYKKDIQNADEIYMMNSVRGMVRVGL